jgi:ribosomal protein S24E
MDSVNIIENKENSLFKRKEVKIVVESRSSPSIKEAEKFVSEKFSANEESIKIKGVYGKFGRTTFLISANIYLSKEEKDKTEQKPKEKKAKVGGTG